MIFLIWRSNNAKNIPLISAAKSPPAAGLNTLFVRGSITSASLNFAKRGIAAFAIDIAPAIAPRTGEPLNSLAAFIPTSIGK